MSFFVTLVIQHAKRMYRIILSFVACLAPPYLSTLGQKRHDFLKDKIIGNKMCVLIFYATLCETFIILRRIHRDIVTNVHTCLCEVPAILVTVSSDLNFLERFPKNP